VLFFNSPPVPLLHTTTPLFTFILSIRHQRK
jgi:hypothetical protein